MKRLYFIFIAALTLSFILTPLPASQGASKANVVIRFNKLVYKPSDKIAINGVIQPLSDIEDARVSLKIGPRDNYAFSRTYFLSDLKRGKRRAFEFNKNSASNFGLKFGSNPLLIEVTQKQKPIYKFSTNLGLINPSVEGRMNLALAINVAHRPYLNMNKNIESQSAFKKLLPAMQEYHKISQQNKTFINYIFSPLLAETLSSAKAQKILDNFNSLFERNISQLILTSYSQVDSSRLSSKSLNDQIEYGRKTLTNIFPKKNVVHRYIAYPNQMLIRNRRENSYLPTTRELLSGSNKMSETMSAFASLSQAFNNNKKKIILVTGNMASPQNITYFIEAAKKQSWLALKPLAHLKPYELKKRPILSKGKVRNLNEARFKYFLLKQALASNNTFFNQAQMAIYLAEDKNVNLAKSKELAKNASALLDKELSKIALKLSPLTLTGREGKLPIKIINNTNSKLNLHLEIKTEGLESKDKRKVFLINPKENLLSIPVKVLESGRHKVLVQLKTGGVVIAQKSFLVSTNLPSVFWYYSGLFLALIVLLILGAFYVRERRSKTSAKS